MGLSRKQYVRTGPVAFSTTANTSVLTPGAGSQPDSIYLGAVEVGNSTGANASCGFGYFVPNAMWKAGQWDDSISASYTDDTTDAQDAGTDDFLMNMASPANDDGFIIQSREKFNSVYFSLTTAGSGGGIATPNYAYWNGSAWTTFTPFLTAAYDSTGAKTFAFLKPADWTALVAADTPVATDGLTAGMYAIKVAWATAPTTEPQADFLKPANLLDYVENVADGASIVFNAQGEIKIPGRASLMAFCNVANAQNWVNVEYRFGG